MIKGGGTVSVSEDPYKQETVTVPVTKGRVLGVDVLRGYARLCDLAAISRPDIYDAKKNPFGTQRDLSPKHARDAYEYVKTRDLAFWPEVFLCVRNDNVISVETSRESDAFGYVSVDLEKVLNSSSIAISRVDGNHRLHYADGHNDSFPPIDRVVSFCLALNLGHEEEIILFRDINNNQARMNTSHLDNISFRLTPEERQKQLNPSLYIAKKLANDSDSPLHDLVHEGGRKVPGTVVPLRTLRTGIEYMLSRPTKLTALDDPDAQAKVIKNYFKAVRKWVPEGWENPKQYLVLRGAGLWGICFIGAEVIDRTLGKGKYGVEDMYEVLSSGKEWDWSNKGHFQGLSGRGGAVKIRDMVTKEFQDEQGVSVRSLFKKIMDE
jgi:DGQHR domain-containing protein